MRTSKEYSSADGTPMVNLNARIREALYRDVKVRCAKDGTLVRKFIEDALTAHLAVAKRRRGADA